MLPVARYDVVVIGAGIAGLTFALALPETFRVALLTKGALGESNTRHAQGGLSAAIGEDDSPGLHEADTIAAGAGLCDVDAVRELVEGAPAAVDWLLALDTHFDRDELTGKLLLGREAAHSRRRVLHAGGDATGAEIERALVAAVKQRASVERFEHAFAVDLVVEHGCCSGVVAQLGRHADLVRLESSAVVIAAGGAGQLWATTSNPPAATADGLAMALRAGVAVADVEFAQFHPTVLSLPGTMPFLVSEAVRGEGAYLRDAAGERFMVAAHPLAELAPRDVVARGIQRQMALDGADHVHLDLRHLDPDAMRLRFPTIAAELARRGLDLATELIPVAPAAHYFMGGIVAGTDGRTSLPGLLALGEASCTGVHGANRLASNSLLEGLVFGKHAADALAGATRAEASVAPVVPATASMGDDDESSLALRQRVQRTMSRHVAVVRDRTGLSQAAAEIDAVLSELFLLKNDGRSTWETTNLALSARAIVSAAALREESRGAHFRADFPETDDGLDGCHLAFGGQRGHVWRMTKLDDARAVRSDAP
ncbi:MAG: L-aspartate oxidase [Thermomicrobiales bacterium]|nr:L-aspartate oxidase [Thermomicrobiales bacterium]